jgi:predicted phage tail protein
MSIGITDACFYKYNRSLVDAHANCSGVTVVGKRCRRAMRVLRALKEKFGSPRVGTETLINGFGAHWQHTSYM